MKGNNKKINAKRDIENAAGRLFNKSNITLQDIAGLAAIKKEQAGGGLPLIRKIKKESPNGFEDSSQQFFTPEKRQASAAKGRTPASHQNRNPNTSSTTKRKRVKESLAELETPAKKSTRSMKTLPTGSGGRSYENSRPYTHEHPAGNQSFFNSPLGVAQPDFPLLSGQALRDQYIKDLYTFLEIDWRRFWNKGSAQHTLNELRTFARAHNNDYGQAPWFHQSFVHGEYGIGSKVYITRAEGPHRCMHMSIWTDFRKFLGMFVERGETNAAGVLNEAVQLRFSGNATSIHHQQVMGLIANPLGIFDISYPFPALGQSDDQSRSTF